MLRTFLGNHVLANLNFVLVLVVGFLCYGLLPPQQDPDMNFNWINITTVFPGASAEDVEKLVTTPLEEAMEKIPDMRFVSSTSRQAISSILVRFNDISASLFDKRLNDLRREVQNKIRELPAGVEDPLVLEITTANAFPTVTVVVRGEEDGENLRRQARRVMKDLERMRGVEKVMATGLHEPELQVRFLPEKLHALGVTPTQLADGVAARFRDLSGGSVRVGGESWLLRFSGTTPDAETMARWSIAGPRGEIRLGDAALVEQARRKPEQLTRWEGKPAVMLAVMKQAGMNSLELTRRVLEYTQDRQSQRPATGVDVALVDDQTHMVRHALAVMEGNAVFGLGMVLLLCWLFLGFKMSILVSLGIPFALAGTFALIYAWDGSLNVMVLLGVVIALGMLVDDAVVVVESIYLRLQQGMKPMDASLDALRESFAPVVSSVLTTVAAFLPLMLLPGILGKFMRVIPLVVSLSLAISLVEAFWMLPSHVSALNISFNQNSPIQRWRNRFLHRLRLGYARVLIRVFRHPRRSLALALAPFPVAVALLAAGLVRFDFFAMDPFPLFYVNLVMPPGTTLEQTMAVTSDASRRVEAGLKPGEARAVVAYAGEQFTETEPLFGDRYGQVMVSLTPDNAARRSQGEIVEALRPLVEPMPGPESLSFFKMQGGPPVSKPINIKVRGDEFAPIQAAVEDVKRVLEAMPEVKDIATDWYLGPAELSLVPDDAAARRAGVSSLETARLVRLLGDGEVAAAFQDQGEKKEVRVLSARGEHGGLAELLGVPVVLSGGGAMPLGELVRGGTRRGVGAIRHYNFRRAITLQADLDQTRMNTVEANEAVKTAWKTLRDRHPGVDLDFTGILDDIYESLDAILTLFLLGVGLMYMILGTQFRSYWQPFLILTTVPMAFTGVTFGLLLAGHPLSLYTLYGVVALSGIAVNSAIVMISAANERREQGMSLLHATLYAGRRRVIPVLVTTTTTIGGLLSLAFGLAGQSLMWGPVATAIVWGLGFSTLLTLFLIPLLYWTFMRRDERKKRSLSA
ncbi:MAG: efflux RND transporter permease subunit [Magnetococcales bacterium]|nr:efflux RND transporter permease subunit [Magnetococcales bacterium]